MAETSREKEKRSMDLVKELLEGVLLAVFLAALVMPIVFWIRRRRKKTNPILVRLYENEEIVVGSTTGEETIAKARHVFAGYLDSDFERWGANVPSGTPTERAKIAVYEVCRDANLAEMFGSIGNLNSHALSQGQILRFVLEHNDKLQPDELATFFLLRVGSGFLVVRISKLRGELVERLERFDDPTIWRGAGRRRVVVLKAGLSK